MRHDTHTGPARSHCLMPGLGVLMMLLLSPIADATILLESGVDVYPASAQIRVLVDPAGSATLTDILDPDRDTEFIPIDGSTSLGFRDEAFWFHGEIENRDHPESTWVFLLEYALLDFVDLYLVDAAGNVQSFSTGDHLPFASRGLPHRHLNFLIELPTGDATSFYLRVQSSSSIQVPIKLQTQAALAQASYDGQFGFGLLYGMLIALLLYNLILFVSMRDLTFLYYVLYVGGFALFQFVINGFAFQYLWPESPGWANTVIVVLMPALYIAMGQFCCSFLNLREYAPRVHRVFVVFMALSVILLLAAFVLDYQLLVRIDTALVFMLITLIIAGAVTTLRQGYRPAFYFILAWAVLLVGISAYASVSFGLLPKSFATEFGFQIGSAAEMILLSFALAYRINVLRDDISRIALDANEMLEARVEARTEDLNQALTALEVANRRLEQASMRDGLTGVHNRRHLDRRLPEMWQAGRAADAWLGLIIMDLDRFKSINDERGHLAGDDCLRCVAKAVGDEIGVLGALFARFGGEEFFVVVAGYGIDETRLLAERLREVVEDKLIVSADQRFKVTASFGVAALRPRTGSDCTELIKRADDALYSAKQAGRNRVVAAAPRVVGGN